MPWSQLLINLLETRRCEVAAKTAIIAGNTKLSYEELSRAIASSKENLIRSFDIKKGSRVLVAFSDEAGAWLDFAIFQIALGLIGACFTVLDTRSRSLSVESRAHVVKLFNPDLFVLIGEVDVSDVTIRRMNFSSACWSFSGSTDTRITCEADSAEAAFVDWTSGSSGGLPKGCVCTHKTLENMFYQKWSPQNGFLNSEEIQVVGYNLFFLWYWWQPLCFGGTSVLFQDKDIRDLSLFTKVVNDSKMDAIDCITPSLLKVIVSHYPRDTGLHFPSNILVSGEALSLDLCSAFMDRFPDHSLINVFSTTETGDAGIARVTKELVSKAMSFGLVACPIQETLTGASLMLRTVPGEDEDPNTGELIVSGVGATEYIGDHEASTKGFSAELGWLSRDKARRVEGCGVAILGRLDDCVKVRGFKIDLHAIEERAREFSGVMEAVAVPDNGERICLFIRVDRELKKETLSKHLQNKLSQSHWPQLINVCADFPLTRTGKLDKRALLASQTTSKEAPISNLEGIDRSSSVGKVIQAFRTVGLEPVDADLEPTTSFWERGGTSLMAISVCHILGIPSSVFLDMSNPSPANVAAQVLDSSATEKPVVTPQPPLHSTTERRVAIVGMSGRWPRDDDSQDASMTSSDLISLLKQEFVPLSPPPTAGGSGNVRKGFYLNDATVEGFDTEFWSLKKSTVIAMDPHQRMFLEMAYEAIIDSGLGGNDEWKSHCGVFASSGSLSHYLELLLNADQESLTTLRESDPGRYLELELGCDKDYVALRAAKMLGLSGPAMTVQAACASALVAVVQAVNAIRTGQCDSALAGGVSLILPQTAHASSPGFIWSQDGGCRPFDANANGTANCNGGHCFVLKRLDLALEDNDSIYAVIEGVGLNNDGHRGKDFVAPSVSGHKQAIQDALRDAHLHPHEVGMVEAHGTGTLLGDPMEYSALAEAYRSDPRASVPVLSIGSVKGNVGHANTAAGALGLAKATVCVFNKILVKSGAFEKLNPHISENPLVRVQTQVEEWKPQGNGRRRIAGISSLGMGGTNCHLIVSESSSGERPKTRWSEDTFPLPLLITSHSESSLRALLLQWEKFLLRDGQDLDMADVAFTMAHCRPAQTWRRTIRNIQDLRSRGRFDLIGPIRGTPKTVVLLFPGQGVDSLPSPDEFGCDAELVALLGGINPLERCPDPVWSQISLFAVSYTVAKQLIDHLCLDDCQVVCVGHSLGEYVAATIAGMMRLEDALEVVRLRAQLLVKYTSGGSMAAVSASAEEVEAAVLVKDVEIACYNRDNRIIVSGPRESVEKFVVESGLECRMVPTVGAFHSRLTEPVKAQLIDFITDRNIEFFDGRFKLVSTYTGGLIQNSLSAEHWGNHTRDPVRMTMAMSAIDQHFPGASFINVGPGITMSQLARRQNCVSLFPNNTEWKPETDIPLRLWELGILSKSSLDSVVPREGRRKVLGIPTVCWDRTRCWPSQATPKNPKVKEAEGEGDCLFYEEVWIPVEPRLVCLSSRIAWFETVAVEEIVKAIFEEGVHACIFGPLLIVEALLVIQAVIEERQKDPFLHVSLSFMIPNNRVEFGTLIGLVRCAISENPDLNMNIVLYSGELNRTTMLLPSVSGEFALEPLRARRIKKYSLPMSPGQIPSRGRFIVTGGLGGIGSALVSWLIAEKQAEEILLLTRRPIGVSDPIWPSEKVSVAIVDLDDADSVKGAIRKNNWSAVFHLAGTVHDSLVSNIKVSEAPQLITSGKLQGLASLMSAIPDVPIYVFSTTSGLLGSPGQGLYAAANVAVDAIAAASGSDRPIVSIQWGGWDATVRNSMSDKFGLKPIAGCERYLSAKAGFEALDKCSPAGGPRVRAVCDIFNWQLYSEKTQILPATVSLLLPLVTEKGWIPSKDQIQDPRLAWIADHTDESGDPLIPATGLIGGLLSESGVVRDVKFMEPLRLGRHFVIDRSADTACIRSGSSVHAKGVIVDQLDSSYIPLVGRMMLARFRQCDFRAMEVLDVEKMYSDLRRGGFDYGPCFRLVREARINSQTGFIIAKITEGNCGSNFSDYGIFWKYSRVLDAASHVASLIDSRASTAFPTSVGEVCLKPNRSREYDSLATRDDQSFFVGIQMSPDIAGEICVDFVLLGPECTIAVHHLVLTPVPPSKTDLITLIRATDSEEFEVVSLATSPPPEGVPAGHFQVIPTGQSLETQFVPIQRSAGSLQDGYVRIEVDTFGLSFLDILATRGVMPLSMFGGEFSGTIVELSCSTVTDLAVGDRVAAVCSGGFGSLMDIRSEYVHVVPLNRSLEESATIPVSVCTALFAIERANIRGNQTVLVHQASGALGMALIRILRSRFPEIRIIGSCSLKKRAFVRELGVDDIIDSRNCDSWPLRSIDVFLGAMDPDILTATIPLLKSFGTIVDVGKRLQFDNVQLPLGPFVRGMTYTTAHLDELMRVDPESVKRLMKEAMQSGISIPYKQFSIGEIHKALEFLSSGQHVGKVIVKFPARARGVEDAHKDLVVDHFGLDDVALHAVRSRSESRVVEIRPIVSLGPLEHFPSETNSRVSLWVHETLASQNLSQVIRRLPRMNGEMVVVPESALIGSAPVDKQFLKARRNLLAQTSTVVKQSETDWLVAAVAKAIGNESLSDSDREASLEQLGIDSLGRLQLSNSFKRQFPHSKLSVQFSRLTSLASIITAGRQSNQAPKKRLLAIHGFRTNALVIRSQLAELIERIGNVEVVTIEGPHPARGPLPDGVENGYEWWYSTKHTSYHTGWLGDDGLDASIEMANAFVRTNGPFDVVIGFSQGAGIAHSLVVGQMIPRGILFSPVAPVGRQWPPSQFPADTSAVVTIMDRSDETTAGYDVGGMTVLTHDEGHRIPKLTDEMIRAILGRI